MPLTEVEKYISANIGPDLLGEEILEQDWVTTWQTYANRYPNRTICQALLDQRLYAGVGNYLKDEILYQLKWHPGRSLKSLSCPDLQSLYRAVILLIHEAYLQGGTTLRNYVRPRGEMGGFQHQLKVYGRSQCPEQHALLNGGQFKDGRSTTWCDQCQTIQ